MALKVFWSKKSTQRFDSIIAYLEEEWGEKSASLFVKKVYEFVNILSVFPEIGSIENRELNIRGFVIIRQITIFYQIRDQKIIILNLFDNRQKSSAKRYKL